MYCILCLEHGIITPKKPNFCICQGCFDKALSIAQGLVGGGQ